MFDMSYENRENLRKLADFLMDNSENIYLDQKFNMSSFATKDGYYVLPTEVHCDTVCCAVGYGPLAGIDPNDAMGWNRYISENFIKDFDKDDYNQTLYVWCFDCDWAYIDNTPYGAALRIYLLLDHPEKVPVYSGTDSYPFFSEMKHSYPFKDEVKEWISKVENKSNV